MYVAHIVDGWQHWPQSEDAKYLWSGSHCSGVANYVDSLRYAGATNDELAGMVVSVCTVRDHELRSWEKPRYTYYDAITLEVIKK